MLLFRFAAVVSSFFIDVWMDWLEENWGLFCIKLLYMQTTNSILIINFQVDLDQSTVVLIIGKLEHKFEWLARAVITLWALRSL